MESIENHINISFQARYFTHGTLSSKTKNIWFVAHGYGQLAQYFIKNFEILDPTANYIVAPEGLSRFYLKGFEGRVGATWMTSEDRLVDIKNYLTFLEKLYYKIIPSVSLGAKINLFGFSQGAATICRWLVEGNINFDRLILWAGIFPPDLQIDTAKKSLVGKEIKLVFGTEDPFLTPERIEMMDKLSNELQVLPEIIKFHGAHHLDPETLLKLA